MNRNPFDLPVDGLDETYPNMEDMFLAFEVATVAEPGMAVKIGNELVDARHIKGMVAYSTFLVTTDTPIPLSRKDRYSTAEMILDEVDNYLDISVETDREVAAAMAELYAKTGRPIGCLAALLRAKRLGETISDFQINQCRKKVLAMDVNRMGDYAEDAYRLASELDHLGAKKLTEVFYQIASESDEQVLSGKAALALLDYYDKHLREDPAYRSEVEKYRKIAEECGFPELVI